MHEEVEEPRSLLGELGHRLKQYFIVGMLVVLPVIVSIEVFVWFLKFLDNILRPVLSRFLSIYVFGFGIVLMLCAVILVGIGVRNYVGRKLVDLVELVFNRLPFIRVIHSAVKQLLEPFSSEKGYSLKQVVLIEYPMKDRLCIGFLAKEHAGYKDGRPLSSVFIPTNHLHLGYLVIMPSDEVVRLDMSVEDALKTAVSCGIVIPTTIRIGDAPNPPDLLGPVTAVVKAPSTARSDGTGAIQATARGTKGSKRRAQP